MLVIISLFFATAATNYYYYSIGESKPSLGRGCQRFPFELFVQMSSMGRMCRLENVIHLEPRYRNWDNMVLWETVSSSDYNHHEKCDQGVERWYWRLH